MDHHRTAIVLYCYASINVNIQNTLMDLDKKDYIVYTMYYENYIDLNYISKIQPRLQQFKRKEITFQLSLSSLVILKSLKQKKISV